MKKWQRSLLAVLSFCLCLLPMTVSATEEDGESISVGNVTLTPETEYAKTDMGTVTTEGATQEDYNIRWEASLSLIHIWPSAAAAGTDGSSFRPAGGRPPYPPQIYRTQFA